ncbi:hypothetical protein GJ744_011362 [Endocarpon pusillum]|uniref:Phosducin domain-containing protein n=1 Tax=Endocarpon pusillum TaxID=364733 RepID=A0A8H7AU71_9EURO|nr:hypothetical protein GJ744_011362 [Endocarpon pusillum]
MTDSLAQEEADRFFSNKDRITTHPEDASDSDNQSEINEKDITTDPYHSDPGDDEDTLHSMAATATATAAYHVPHTFFDANTGPKGVIADARSFNRAKKTSLRNTFLNITSGHYFQQSSKSRQTTPPTGSDSTEKSGSGHEDEDDEFMEQWRQSRLRELAAGGSQKQQRRQSPSKRKWGFFKEVDASGYLDAVEKTASDTVVVVCIYDPESDDSAAVEESLHILAQKHATTRFVKLHHEIAEMEHVGAPAIIAYQNGDVIAMLTDCSAVGLETNLRRNGMLVDTTY